MNQAWAERLRKRVLFAADAVVQEAAGCGVKLPRIVVYIEMLERMPDSDEEFLRACGIDATDWKVQA